MRFILRLAAFLVVNAIVLLVARNIVSGFIVQGKTLDILLLAAIFMMLNLTLRPLLKLMLGPIILLTLGAGLLLVNGIVLLLLDFFSTALTIESTAALVYATLLISATHFVLMLLIRRTSS